MPPWTITRDNRRRPRGQTWVWKCNIQGVQGDDQNECHKAFESAPELRHHYIYDHQLAPADVSLSQQLLMVREPWPEGEFPPICMTVRGFLRDGFDPHWPTGPTDDIYGPWMVRHRGRPTEALRDARRQREERNPRGWARFFVPDWYYDEISRRARMSRGQMWP